MIERYISIYLDLASPEVNRRVGFVTAIIFLHIFCAFVPGHHVRRRAVVEVFEVHLLLVVEQGQVDHVAVMSPRAKFDVALLLLLNSEDVNGRQYTP